jgi:hypothetical protein
MTAKTNPPTHKQDGQLPNEPGALAQLDHRVVLYGLLSCVHYGWNACARRQWDKVPFSAFRLVLHVGMVWYSVKASRSPTAGHPNSSKIRSDKIWMVIRALTSVSLLMNAFEKFQRMPCIWDSDVWTMQSDVFLAVWLVSFSGLNGGDGTDDGVAFLTIRDMFANYYFAAAFWKINSHFLDPNASCATMFVVQIVTRYVAPIINIVAADPAATLIAVASTAKSIAPVSALIVELAFGLFMVFGSLFSNAKLQAAGSLVALVFHLMVCALPSPNDISDFALSCGARHVAFASVVGTQEAMNFVGRHAVLLAAALAVGFSIGFQPDNNWTGPNWAFFFFIFVGGFVVLSISNDLLRHDAYSSPDAAQQSQKQDQQSSTKDSILKPRAQRPFLSKVAVGIAFAYSFVAIMLGVQEEGTANMFANLKVHGGSNHLFLPTGLLFHWFGAGSAGSTNDSHPFGGGVIRIENTTSQWLRTVYPADLTHFLMPENVVDVLASIGSPSPVYFNPGANRNLGLLNAVPDKFYRYTVPALEFKRLLHEAKERDQTFELTYSKLPGTRGDEVWRATATEMVVSVKFQDGVVVECTNRRVLGDQRSLSDPRVCEKNDLPWVSYTQTVPWILRRISMYHAYPITVATNAIDIPPSIVCFGP